MNNATKQRKEVMKIFDEIRFKNKGVKKQELTKDIQKAIKAIRLLAIHKREL